MAWKRHKQYRLYGFDYSQNGLYFVTIVTKDRLHTLGEIIDEQMHYSPIGQFIEARIRHLLEIYPVIQIDEWQIMPNHLHLIVSILGTEELPYQYAQGLQPLAKNSLSAFINHFKGKITRWCNENNQPDFKWQSRFHERIIRNETEYVAIAQYIRKNVENWDKDKENPIPGAPKTQERAQRRVRYTHT